MANEPAVDDGGLIFQWERRARSRWWLVLMLAGSLGVHAASFYALQVAYTPTGTQGPPPTPVVLVPLDQPENAPFAHWLAMNDPALTTRLAAPTAAQTLAALPFHYVPSYNAALPPFKPLDLTDHSLNIAPPRVHSPGPAPLPPPVVPGAPRASEDLGRTTRVVLSGPVGLPAETTLPPVRFTVAGGTNVLDPTVFLVGARPESGEPFLFRQATSGNPLADEYARGYLAALGLQPVAGAAGGSDEAAWGVATFYWGSDVYR